MNDYKPEPASDPLSPTNNSQSNDYQHIASFYEPPPPIAVDQPQVIQAEPAVVPAVVPEVVPVSVLTQTPVQISAPVQVPVSEPVQNSIVSDTVSNYAKPKTSSGKGLCVVIVILIVIILASLAGITIFTVQTLKNRYVPSLSPVLEDYVNSPAEQFAQRIDIYLDKINASLATDNFGIVNNQSGQDLPAEISGLTNIALISQLNIKLTMPTSPVTTPPVLGATTGGTLNQDTIAQMLKDKEIDFDLTSEQKYDALNTANPASSVAETLTVSSTSNQFGTSFNLTSLKGSANTNDLFFHLDYFPVNDYLNTTSIENKWVFFPGNLLTPSSLTTTSNPLSTDNTQQIGTTINNIKLFLRSDSMKKAITAAPAQTINGTATKCYAINIATADWANIMTDYETIFNTDTATKMNIQNYFLTTLAKSGNSLNVNNTICFGSDLIIRKVDYNGTAIAPDANLNLTYTGSVQVNSINQVNNISAPTDNIINYQDIDLKTLAPSLSTLLPNTTLTPTGTPGLTGNAKRSYEIESLGKELSNYLFANNSSNSSVVIVGVPDCPQTAKIGTAAGNIDLIKILSDTTKTTLSGFADPAGGNASDTGYTICRTGSDNYTLAAPFADYNQNIATIVIIP